jgi:hypothetical protein
MLRSDIVDFTNWSPVCQDSNRFRSWLNQLTEPVSAGESGKTTIKYRNSTLFLQHNYFCIETPSKLFVLCPADSLNGDAQINSFKGTSPRHGAAYKDHQGCYEADEH